MELYVLVEKSPTDLARILKIVRTYESDSRAQRDVELLNDLLPDCVFEVIAVAHIEH